MWSVLTQIVPCLFLAALLGVIVAWLLRNLFWKEKFAGVEDEWETKLRDRERQFEGNINDLNARLGRVKALEADITAKTTEHSKLLARIGELEPLAIQLKERDTKLANWESRWKTADAELGKLKARIGELEPLNAQIANRDMRIKELEAKIKDRKSVV